MPSQKPPLRPHVPLVLSTTYLVKCFAVAIYGGQLKNPFLMTSALLLGFIVVAAYLYILYLQLNR